MTDDQLSDPPDEVDELAHFEPFVRAVVKTWTDKGAVEVENGKEDLFVAELKFRAGEAETPYKMLKALAKQVEVSECVEEYYASREELIDQIRHLAEA